MLMKFIGMSDRIFPWLVTGCVYDVTFRKELFSKGIIASIEGHSCPYSSMEAFKSNWEEVEDMNEQMVLLRNALDKMGIAWRDATGDCAGFGQICAGFGTICRTHWEFNGHEFSAIHGFGSYGYEIGLLELMIDDDEPIGYLSAIDVIDLMDGR